VALLATLLPLAVLVAAGAVGRVLWQRHLHRDMRQLLSGQQPEDLQGLLFHTSRCSHEASRQQGCTSGDGLVHMPVGQKQRLKAALQSRLAGDFDAGGSTGGGRGIELMPVEALPDALAHHLGSMRPQPPGTSSNGNGECGAGHMTISSSSSGVQAARNLGIGNLGGSAGDSSGGGMHSVHFTAASYPAQMQELVTEQDAGLLGSVPAGSAGYNSTAVQLAAHSAQAGRRQRGECRWGLPTESLRLSPGELVVRLACRLA